MCSPVPGYFFINEFLSFARATYENDWRLCGSHSTKSSSSLGVAVQLRHDHTAHVHLGVGTCLSCKKAPFFIYKTTFSLKALACPSQACPMEASMTKTMLSGSTALLTCIIFGKIFSSLGKRELLPPAFLRKVNLLVCAFPTCQQ